MALQYNHEAILQKEHRGPILSLSFNADASLIACGSSDGKLTIWSCGSGQLFIVISCYHGQDCAFLCTSWLPGKTNMLLCGMESGQLVCVKIESDYVLASGYSIHTLPVECLSFCDTNEMLATAAFHEVKVWQYYQTEGNVHWDLTSTLGLPRSLGENRNAEVIVTSLNWVANEHPSQTLLVTYLNHGVVFWDIGSDGNNDAHCLSILSFAASTSISPDHRYIAISNLRTGFDLYDAQSKSPLRGFPHVTSCPSFSPVCFVHDGFALLGGSSDGVARIWDVTTGYAIEPLVHKENDNIWALASHSDTSSGRVLIATSAKAPSRLPYVVIWRARDIYKQRNMRNPKSVLQDHVVHRHTWLLLLVASLFVGAGIALHCMQ